MSELKKLGVEYIIFDKNVEPVHDDLERYQVLYENEEVVLYSID